MPHSQGLVYRDNSRDTPLIMMSMGMYSILEWAVGNRWFKAHPLPMRMYSHPSLFAWPLPPEWPRSMVTVLERAWGTLVSKKCNRVFLCTNNKTIHTKIKIGNTGHCFYYASINTVAATVEGGAQGCWRCHVGHPKGCTQVGYAVLHCVTYHQTLLLHWIVCIVFTLLQSTVCVTWCYTALQFCRHLAQHKLVFKSRMGRSVEGDMIRFQVSL